MLLNDSKKVAEINLIILIEFLLSLCVVVGFVLGVFGAILMFYYFLVAWWLIPLTIANLVLSIIEETGTEKGNVAIFVLALLSLIPVFGIFASIGGILVTCLNLFKLYKNLTLQTII